MSEYEKRLAGLLRKREAQMGPNAYAWQVTADNSPVGAVGAPSGLLQPPTRQPAQRMGGLLGVAGMMPGPTGDVLGPVADAYMYATDPSSRTPGNFALSALGLLPFVPSMGAAMKLDLPWQLEYMGKKVPALAKSWTKQDPSDFAKWAVYDSKTALQRFHGTTEEAIQYKADLVAKKAKEQWPDASDDFINKTKEASHWVLRNAVDSRLPSK